MNRPAIWLPPSHSIHNRKPVFLCNLCEAAWYEPEDRWEYERHVMKAHSHDEIRQHSLAVRAPGLFDPNAGDAEWSEWIRRNHEAGNDPMKYMRTDDGKHSSGLGDG